MGKENGVKLQVGNAILQLLAEWGLRAPLEAVEASYEEKTRRPNFKGLQELLDASKELEPAAEVPHPSTPKRR